MPVLPIRSALVLVLSFAVATLWGSTAFAKQTDGIDSGGLGLTKTAWEATYGPGAPVRTTGPIYHDMHEYRFEHGTVYAAFEGSKTAAESVVMYLEVVFGGDGMPEEQARDVVQSLLPSDAGIIEPYFAPPTPGAPSALNTFRYESAALDGVPYGTDSLSPSFLVIYVERFEERRVTGGYDVSWTIEPIVTRASIVAAIPVG